MKKIALIFILVIIISIVVYAQSTTWVFDKQASVSDVKLLHKWSDDNCRYDYHYLYRAIDWQTGNVIYITTTERGGDGRASTSSISVVKLQTKSAY